MGKINITSKPGKVKVTTDKWLWPMTPEEADRLALSLVRAAENARQQKWIQEAENADAGGRDGHPHR